MLIKSPKCESLNQHNWLLEAQIFENVSSYTFHNLDLARLSFGDLFLWVFYMIYILSNKEWHSGSELYADIEDSISSFVYSDR